MMELVGDPIASTTLWAEKNSAKQLVPPQSPIVHPSTSANAVIHETTRQAMNYRSLSTGPDRILWLRSMANNLGRLAQGVGQRQPPNQRIAGTNTIFFIPKCDVSFGRQVTYCQQEASLRPTKAESHRVRNFAVWDCLDFPGPTATQTASLVTTKLLLNSTLSTPNARFSAFDNKNFYYDTPMSWYEYIKLHISKIPDKIIE
jgi:hypothetical protein